MEWKDQGIIIGTRRHGETSVIAEIMTRHHGRHLGLVRGGRSRKQQPFLQPGNSVDAGWRARLDEHLGIWQLEPVEQRAATLIQSSLGVFGIQTLAAHLRLLPERDAHENLYEALSVILDHLDNAPIAAALVVRFELALLEDLGFGLDLSKCAVTGVVTGLTHVSPKTGRAVSRQAAEPWLSKLLPLPGFLLARENRSVAIDNSTADELNAGFALAAYFFGRHVYQPRGLAPPQERAGFLKAALRELNS